MRSEQLELEILRLGRCDLPQSRETYLYFVQTELTGAVKIGVADDPRSRLRELQCGNHETLRIAAAWKTHAGLERFVHKHLRAMRIRGEWFRPNYMLADVLDALTFIYGAPEYGSLHPEDAKAAETFREDPLATIGTVA